MLATSNSTSTAMATGPLFLTISTIALEPSGDDAPWAAPPSGGNCRTKAAIKIGVHLTINGSRRRAPLQVIDLVRGHAFPFDPQARGAVQRAMLRSESRCGCLFPERC